VLADTLTTSGSQRAADMEMAHKFVDPMDALFLRPPRKTKLEALGDFLYDSDEGSCLGRTPKQWGKCTGAKQIRLTRVCWLI
jgi:hypothetical protein